MAAPPSRAHQRTPDGHSKLELTQDHTPAALGASPQHPPPNTLGLHRVRFAVDDIAAVVARLRPHGAALVGELAQDEDRSRLCYVRGPAGIIVALAEQLRERPGAAARRPPSRPITPDRAIYSAKQSASWLSMLVHLAKGWYLYLATRHCPKISTA